MGSTSDWDTMCHTAEILEKFQVPFEKEVVSAHRTPVWMAEFAQGAEARGIEVIIAGAGGAAHLPGYVIDRHGDVRAILESTISLPGLQRISDCATATKQSTTMATATMRGMVPEPSGS